MDRYVLNVELTDDLRVPFVGTAVSYQRMVELRRELGIGGRTTFEALRQEALQKAAQQ